MDFRAAAFLCRRADKTGISERILKKRIQIAWEKVLEMGKKVNIIVDIIEKIHKLRKICREKWKGSSGLAG